MALNHFGTRACLLFLGCRDPEGGSLPLCHIAILRSHCESWSVAQRLPNGCKGPMCTEFVPWGMVHVHFVGLPRSQVETMRLFVDHPVTPLDDFLLDETSPQVQRHFESLRRSRSTRKDDDDLCMEDAEGAKWVEARQDFVESFGGFSWAPPAQMAQDFPGLLEVTPRAWFVLHAHGLTQAALPTARPQAIDLSQRHSGNVRAHCH